MALPHFWASFAYRAAVHFSHLRRLVRRSPEKLSKATSEFGSGIDVTETNVSVVVMAIKPSGELAVIGLTEFLSEKNCGTVD